VRVVNTATACAGEHGNARQSSSAPRRTRIIGDTERITLDASATSLDAPR